MGKKSIIQKINKIMYFINKQMIPGNNLIWVLKLNEADTIYSFDSLEYANLKKEELQNSDTSGRIYKVTFKNDDGAYTYVVS
jgi:hypothetical protein